MKYEFVPGDEITIAPGRTVKRIRHGMRHSPEYGVWCGIIQRCTNPNCKDFKAYGAKGIDVDSRWLSFVNFYADMGARPSGFQIDRTDNSKGYSPDNCKWVSRQDNNRNRSGNRFVEFNGKNITITEASQLSGIRRETLTARINRGSENLFSKPLTPSECAYSRITRARDRQPEPNTK